MYIMNVNAGEVELEDLYNVSFDDGFFLHSLLHLNKMYEFLISSFLDATNKMDTYSILMISKIVVNLNSYLITTKLEDIYNYSPKFEVLSDLCFNWHRTTSTYRVFKELTDFVKENSSVITMREIIYWITMLYDKHTISPSEIKTKFIFDLFINKKLVVQSLVGKNKLYRLTSLGISLKQDIFSQFENDN